VRVRSIIEGYWLSYPILVGWKLLYIFSSYCSMRFLLWELFFVLWLLQRGS
jgi:hypothetical protein